MENQSNNSRAPKDGVFLTAKDMGESDEERQAEDHDDDEAATKIFNVRDAVPPTDYDAPYSQLPSNVVLKRVKEKVK
tara:strand:- start:1127 stop:1357 length:231 start_codon:yes stop_codon:yes gene_type:complete